MDRPDAPAHIRDLEPAFGDDSGGGLLGAAREVIEAAGSRLEIDDRRNPPTTIAVASTMTLTPVQEAAVDALRAHEHSVSRSPTSAVSGQHRT